MKASVQREKRDALLHNPLVLLLSHTGRYPFVVDFTSRSANSIAMASNLHLDLQLLARAKKFGGFQSKKETINHALSEFVRRHEQKNIADLFGTIDFFPDFDHKKLRAKR